MRLSFRWTYFWITIIFIGCCGSDHIAQNCNKNSHFLILLELLLHFFKNYNPLHFKFHFKVCPSFYILCNIFPQHLLKILITKCIISPNCGVSPLPFALQTQQLRFNSLNSFQLLNVSKLPIKLLLMSSRKIALYLYKHGTFSFYSHISMDFLSLFHLNAFNQLK